jgi:hypothetical protein
MEALAWEQEPPKTHSVSRSFFDRGVGSSILASLSEAGGNDQHSSLSKPLPPRSQTCESRLSECVHVFLIVHALCQSVVFNCTARFPYFCCSSGCSLGVLLRWHASIVLFREDALPPRESHLAFDLNLRPFNLWTIESSNCHPE